MTCKKERMLVSSCDEMLARERRVAERRLKLKGLYLWAVLPKREAEKLLSDIEDLLDKNRSTYDLELVEPSPHSLERWDRVVGVEGKKR